MVPFHRSLVAAATLSAAFGFAAGCGNNNSSPGVGKKQSNSIMHTLPANSNGAGKKGGKAANSATLTDIMNDDTALQNHTSVLKEALVSGTYTLTQTTTSVYYHMGKPGEELRAIHTAQVSANPPGSTQVFLPDDPSMKDAQNKAVAMLVSGAMKADTDSGRNLDVPLNFSIDTSKGAWQPSWASAAEVTIHDQLHTDAQNPALQDAFQAATQGLNTSVMDLLATGQGQQNTTNAADKAYVLKDSNNVEVHLHLLQVSAQSLRIWVSFDEKSVTATSSSPDETFIRNLYLDYTIAAAPGTAANGATPGGTDPKTKTAPPAATGDTGTTPGPETTVGNATPSPSEVELSQP